MKKYQLQQFSFRATILALGAESAGNFSIYQNGKIYFSKDFSDLLDEKNFDEYKTELNKYLKIKKIKPDIILTDLHPSYKTTILGQEMAIKYKAKYFQIQHHIAHTFSAIGDKIILNTKYQIPNTIYGIALDGTGYGFDEKIWGGEIFKIQNTKYKIQANRIGYLENQTMIGGELAIKKPARMLLGILNKIISDSPSPLGRGCHVLVTGEGKGKLQRKNIIYSFVKKYYTRNEFELLYNQLQKNFNCIETSSTGRILDAVSLLLGFCGNERKYKHEPTDLLEKNSTKPYANLKPIIKNNILLTTPLFEYLIKKINKNKNLSADEAGRLAATAQLYIAEGLHEIILKENMHDKKNQPQNAFLAGGLANNKIISNYLESKNFYANKKTPRGDAGLSFGQVVYFLSTISKPKTTASQIKSSS